MAFKIEKSGFFCYVINYNFLRKETLLAIFVASGVSSMILISQTVMKSDLLIDRVLVALSH